MAARSSSRPSRALGAARSPIAVGARVGDAAGSAWPRRIAVFAVDEGGTGVGAEPVGEAGAQCGEHVERVGGVAETGEGVHEREVRGLVERVALGAGLHQWQGAGEVAEGGAGGHLEIVEGDAAHEGRRAEVARRDRRRAGRPRGRRAITREQR